MIRSGLLLLAVLAAACPTPTEDDDSATPEPTPAPGPGRLDTSEVGEARVGEAYEGRLAVAEYDGSVRYTPGILPDGLELTEDGLLHGTPTRFGFYEFSVVATDLDGLADFTGRVALRVRPPLATRPFLGFARPHVNNAWLDYGLLRDPWLRVSAGDPAVFVLEPGIYTAGPDGEDTAGLGDDELVEALGLDEVTVEVGDFVPTPDVDPSPPSYPSGHYAEGDPLVWDPVAGRITAGVDTGETAFVLRHPEHPDVSFRVAVLPPDWCPSEVATSCE